MSRASNCKECSSILELIKGIDCKMFELSDTLYNNISYMTNKKVPSDIIMRLLYYREILFYKYNSFNHLPSYDIEIIKSRVRLLIRNCKQSCDCPSQITLPLVNNCIQYLFSTESNEVESIVYLDCNDEQQTFQFIGNCELQEELLCLKEIISVTSGITYNFAGDCTNVTTTTTTTLFCLSYQFTNPEPELNYKIDYVDCNGVVKRHLFSPDVPVINLCVSELIAVSDPVNIVSDGRCNN